MTSSANTQAQNKDYELAHPSIQAIYELLKHVKGMNLKIQSSRNWRTQDNNRLSKRNAS